MNTVLITGCSSGFGLNTAKSFLERDWNVIASMRSPREDLLPPSARLRVLGLDVTDSSSIRRVVETAGPIDVLVNNAGIGLATVFETTSMETVREVFATNTFGTMAMTQAFVAFTESLALELEPFNVRLNPGLSPETRFADGARRRMKGDVPEDYAGFVQHVFAKMGAGYLGYPAA